MLEKKSEAVFEDCMVVHIKKKSQRISKKSSRNNEQAKQTHRIQSLH